MKFHKYLLALPFLLSCNSYNDKMNNFLKNKKIIETSLDTNQARDQRFREITGYDEMDDSLSIGTVYPHPELVDSIRYLKLEKEFFKNELKQLEYSKDSLQKLK